MQQQWYATEKEAFAVYLSVLKFNLYWRGAQFIQHCDHKTLEPFLSCSMKTHKLNGWSMELSDYNLMLDHIKGSNSIFFRCNFQTENTRYLKRTIRQPKNMSQWSVLKRWLVATYKPLSVDKLHVEQKDIHCKKLAAQSYHTNRNTFKLVLISPDGL